MRPAPNPVGSGVRGDGPYGGYAAGAPPAGHVRKLTPPRRKNYITLRGISLFTLVTTVMVIALATTPLDTLDYVVAFFLSLLLVSVVWARRALTGVEATLTLPPGGMEGQTVRYAIAIQNRTPLNRTLVQVFFYTPFFTAPVLFRIPRLRGQENLSFLKEGVCSARGIYPSFELTLASEDPLALFQVRERRTSINPFTVYPRVVPVRYFVRESGAMPQQSPVPARTIEGLGDEFMGVRDYVTGDSLKKVHWLTTARVGRLMVKQFVKESAGSFYVVVDTGAGQVFGAGRKTTLELGLVAAASIASYFIREGALGDIYFEEPEGQRFSIGSGPAQLETILHKLASVKGDSTAHLPEVLRSVFQRLQITDNVLVVISSALDPLLVEALTTFSGLPRTIEFCYVNPFAFATDEQAARLPSWEKVEQWLSYLRASRVQVYNVEREEDLAQLG